MVKNMQIIRELKPKNKKSMHTMCVHSNIGLRQQKYLFFPFRERRDKQKKIKKKRWFVTFVEAVAHYQLVMVVKNQQ